MCKWVNVVSVCWILREGWISGVPNGLEEAPLMKRAGWKYKQKDILWAFFCNAANVGFLGFSEKREGGE